MSEMYKCPNVQKSTCLNVKMSKYPNNQNVQKFLKCTNCTNVQISKFPNVQNFENFQNAKMSICLNVHKKGDI
jgi:hypothetical protein